MRVDTGPRLGNGHLMRCLALGQALRRAGSRVVFLSRIASAPLTRRLRSERMVFMPMKRRSLGGAADARDTAAAAKKWRAGWIVVDGHHFSPSYQRRLASSEYRLMLVDDHGGAPSAADLILNQNLHARRSLYARAPDSTLLLGTRHALLRPEFARWQKWQRTIASVGAKVLITMGGSDPQDSAGKVLRALASLERRLRVVVVVGAHYRFGRRLRAQAQNSPHRVRIIRETDRMAKLMAWADLGISTFGTTSWEMAFMGLPAVSLVVEAHQEPFARAMARHGALVKIDQHMPSSSPALGETVRQVLLSSKLRLRMSRRGRALVDGRGSERVLKAMGLAGTSR